MPEESMHIRDRERSVFSDMEAIFSNMEIVDVNTDLGRYEADNLNKTLGDTGRQKVQNIVVNLSRVRNINSTCIGILVGVAKQLRRMGGSLKICGLADNVKRAIDLTGASAFLEIYDSEDSALAQSKNSE